MRNRRTFELAVLVAVLAAALAAGLALTDGGAKAQGTSVSSEVAPSPILAEKLALARVATAKYATNLAQAKADGYQIITRMIPNMGYHFLNPNVTGFDVQKPAILVYERRGDGWQLGALEWVFPKVPDKEPIEGARYGVFGAACHYVDGTFVFASAQSDCAPTSPTTGAAFNFWHPSLVTLHIWIWYPNPTGLYSGTNPLVAPFNAG